MRSSEKNQELLRAFLTEVRTTHGLTRFDFAPLIGLKRSIFYAWDRKERNFGCRSLKAIARALSLSNDVTKAMLDPAAPPATLPAVASISLPIEDASQAVPEILIDLEMANKMMSMVSAAGKPVPLSKLLLQFIH